MLTEQIQEYSESIEQFRIKQMEAEHDMKSIKTVYVKDIKTKQYHYKKQLQSKEKKRKDVLKVLIEKIVQGNEAITISFALNPFLTYELNNDLSLNASMERNKIAKNNF